MDFEFSNAIWCQTLFTKGRTNWHWPIKFQHNSISNFTIIACIKQNYIKQYAYLKIWRTPSRNKPKINVNFIRLICLISVRSEFEHQVKTIERSTSLVFFVLIKVKPKEAWDKREQQHQPCPGLVSTEVHVRYS